MSKGYSDYELRMLARMDAESDVELNFRVSEKNQYGFRKLRVERFTNEYDKPIYYEHYNRFYKETLELSVIKAVRFLEFVGYTVTEKE